MSERIDGYNHSELLDRYKAEDSVLVYYWKISKRLIDSYDHERIIYGVSVVAHYAYISEDLFTPSCNDYKSKIHFNISFDKGSFYFREDAEINKVIIGEAKGNFYEILIKKHSPKFKRLFTRVDWCILPI